MKAATVLGILDVDGLLDVFRSAGQLDLLQPLRVAFKEANGVLTEGQDEEPLRVADERHERQDVKPIAHTHERIEFALEVQQTMKARRAEKGKRAAAMLPGV